MSDTYHEFLRGKTQIALSSGIEVEDSQINPMLFPFQRAITRWALRKGRCAIFASTGLGKTFMQLEWSRLLNEMLGAPILILAPLAVARQTEREAAKLGIKVTFARNQLQASSDGITVTNYEMLHHFGVTKFKGVVLDESSCLKDFTSKTRNTLIEVFKDTPYRLCCTATPAPNDITEIANHAEFLGITTRVKMLATFFVHDDKGWRIKKHAARGPFYQWLASWAIAVNKPSDLGFDDAGYDLPTLDIELKTVASNYIPEGMLFATGLHGITERTQVRKATLNDRAEAALELVKAEPDEQWLVWTGLNDESAALSKSIDGAVEVKGSDGPDYKADSLMGFADGKIKVVVTKPDIAGWGMNFQSCARAVFVGLGDSYEQYFQSIRRIWRFGQKRAVKVYIVLSDLERVIYENVLRKEKEAAVLSAELIKHVADFEKAEIGQMTKKVDYKTDTTKTENYTLMLGDSGERLKELPDNSVDLMITSIPFQSLYVYSPSDRDLGNSDDPDQFWTHMTFITNELMRVMKPGRSMCIHVQQITTTKQTDGVIGMRDFRGDAIRHYVNAGFTYHGEVCIDKDPQAQAIRTHSKGLLFVQFHKDSIESRPAFADYIIVMRKPGDNAVPVHPELTNEEWIEFARPIWYGIKESDTLNVAVARSNDDERHICPLQLGTIERCIKLWSNRGETVLDPFMGIGSVAYEAICQDRKAVGVELKPEYYKVSLTNVSNAQSKRGSDLFSWAEAQQPKPKTRLNEDIETGTLWETTELDGVIVADERPDLTEKNK